MRACALLSEPDPCTVGICRSITAGTVPSRSGRIMTFGYKFIEILLLVVALSLLHAWLRRRLLAIAAPFRYDLAVRGERLLLDDRLASQHREIVSFCLDVAYSGWFMPLLAISFIVITIYQQAKWLFCKITDKPESTSLFASLPDPELRSEFRFILLTFLVSVAAASPISALIFVLQIPVMAIFGLPPRSYLLSLQKPVHHAGRQRREH